MAKSLPFHKEAEQSVLGAIFLDPKIIVSVIDQLDVDDFFDHAHMMIYQAMRDLYQENLKIDFASVGSKLEQTQELVKSGGMKYILELADFVPSTAHIETYIDLVKDGSLKRQVIHLAGEILEEGYKGDAEANSYLTMAEERIFALAQKRKTSAFAIMSDVIKEVKAKTEKIEIKKVVSLVYIQGLRI